MTVPYLVRALCAVTVFALVHFFAQKTSFSKKNQARFLSSASGVTLAYVFLGLLPKLAFYEVQVGPTLSGLFPFLERHVYLLALFGYLFFYRVDVQSFSFGLTPFQLSVFAYSFFNFLVGYAVVDPNNPEVRPLLLFTFAIGLHYFINDYHLNKRYGDDYRRVGKWVLILSLFIGWLVGCFFTLEPTSIAIVSAFIAGGVLMNTTRHELASENPKNFGYFFAFSLLYSFVLLAGKV